jgi:hypothetical protein
VRAFLQGRPREDDDVVRVIAVVLFVMPDLLADLDVQPGLLERLAARRVLRRLTRFRSPRG